MISFSVIMPSYLGIYPQCAKDRENKLIRAIDSVMNQTYKHWELIIISDGCDKTVEILTQYFKENKKKNVALYLINKQKIWSGVRNVGIRKAENDYIIYLDTDDFYHIDYLKNLSKEIEQEKKQWYFVDDFKMKGNNFKVDLCEAKLGMCGTSNIIHSRKLNVFWDKSDYKEDYVFIKKLVKEKDYKRLNTVGYYVCHIPNKYDV